MIKAAPGEIKPPRVVLDTDTYNEIDDQFALVYALHSPEDIDLRGIVAAPFFNDNSTGPADGMEKSFQEIRLILQMTGFDADIPAYRGATAFLENPGRAVDSEGARFIVAEARRARAEGEVLHVVGIGAITNIASALIAAPDIAEDIEVVWLGGHAREHPDTREFNFFEDVAAVRAVLASGVAFAQYPCCPCVEALSIRLPELRRRLEGCGAVGEYLTRIFAAAVEGDEGCSRVIWDVSTISYFVLPEATVFATEPAPSFDDEARWTDGPPGRPIRVARSIDRGRVFDSLFARIRRHTPATALAAAR